MYALVLTDRQAAIDFNNNYPRVIGTYTDSQGNIREYPPDFPDEIADKIQQVKNSLFFQGNYTKLQMDESSLAFILQQFHTGISLVKMNAGGSFKKLKTDETDVNGEPAYTVNNCL